MGHNHIWDEKWHKKKTGCCPVTRQLCPIFLFSFFFSRETGTLSSCPTLKGGLTKCGVCLSKQTKRLKWFAEDGPALSALERERGRLSRTLSCAGAPLFDRANKNSFVYGLRHSETGCSQSGAVPALTWNMFYRNTSCPNKIHRCD